MEDTVTLTNEQIAEAYRQHHQHVHDYIYHRVHDWELANDFTQDVFLRLFDYKLMLRVETIKNFIFTIAHNLLVDHWRRHALRQAYNSYIYDYSALAAENTESKVMANELLSLEQSALAAMPAKRRKVYMLSRFEGATIPEISQALQISTRTTESHLFSSRKFVRQYIKECI